MPIRVAADSASRPGRANELVRLTIADPWPNPLPVISPGQASARLADLLGARGIEATRTCDDRGISLVTTGRLNIWVEPTAFAWNDGNGGRVRRPFLDLQNVVEDIIALVEQTGSRSPASADEPC